MRRLDVVTTAATPLEDEYGPPEELDAYVRILLEQGKPVPDRFIELTNMWRANNDMPLRDPALIASAPAGFQAEFHAQHNQADHGNWARSGPTLPAPTGEPLVVLDDPPYGMSGERYGEDTFDWRYLPVDPIVPEIGRARRATALFQGSYETNRAVRRAARNLAEGRPVMDGVEIPRAPWGEGWTDADGGDQGQPLPANERVGYDYEDFANDIAAAAEWLNEGESGPQGTLFRGLTIDTDATGSRGDIARKIIADHFPEGSTIEFDYTSATPVENLARRYSVPDMHGHRSGRSVMIEIRGADGVRLPAFGRMEEAIEVVLRDGAARIVEARPTTWRVASYDANGAVQYTEEPDGGVRVVVEMLPREQRRPLAAAGGRSLVAELLDEPLWAYDDEGRVVNPARVDTDTFHLKGTEHDHDQQSHAGGGGAMLEARHTPPMDGPLRYDEANRKYAILHYGTKAVADELTYQEGQDISRALGRLTLASESIGWVTGGLSNDISDLIDDRDFYTDRRMPRENVPLGLAMQLSAVKYATATAENGAEIMGQIRPLIDQWKAGDLDPIDLGWEIEAIAGISERHAAVRSLATAWNWSTVGPQGQALQMAAERLAGLGDAGNALRSNVATANDARELGGIAFPVFSAVQRVTQRALADLGVGETITAHRGLRGVDPADYEVGDVIQPYPLSSWTTSASYAAEFTGLSKDGPVVTVQVPREDVWSLSSATGFGDHDKEIVVLGNWNLIDKVRRGSEVAR